MTAAGTLTEPAVARIDAPYKGLTYFTEDDSEIFFGRTSDRRLLATTLLASHFSVVYGESGVGKSSLLRAGVVHDLRERALRERAERAAEGPAPGGARFVPAVCSTWVDDPVRAVDAAVRSASVGLAEHLPSVPTEGTTLDELVESWCHLSGAALLLVLDQFEEYLLYHPADGDDPIGDGLARALSRRDLNVRFMVSIREDSLAKLDRYEDRVPNLLDDLIRVEHLDRASGEEAIRGPIGRFNAGLDDDEPPVEIEDALVADVLTQVEREAPAGGGEAAAGAGIETAYLQLVMQRLWEVERGHGSSVLRQATFEALGGATSIVFAHLDDAMRELTASQQAVAAKAFARLVTPSRQKYAQSPSDLAKLDELDPRAVTAVLGHLEKRRILKPVAPAPGVAEPRYEIFHDKLADPILDWRARFEQQAKGRRDRRRAAILGSVALVSLAIAAALAVLAFIVVQERDARRKSSSRALAAAALQWRRIDPSQSLRVAAQALGKADTPEAEDAFRAALSTPHAERVLERPEGGAVSSAIFARDGRVLTVDGAASLWSLGDGKRVTVGPAGASVTDAVLSRSGTAILTFGGGSAAQVWSTATGKPVGGLLKLAARPVGDPALGPDGAHVVTAGVAPGRRGTGVTTVLDVRTAKAVARRETAAPALVLGFSADGARVVEADGDGSVSTWRWADGRRRARRYGAIGNALISPDGSRVVTSEADGTTRLWDVTHAPTATVLLARDAPSAGFRSAAFSADGHFLVLVGADGATRVWDARTGRRRSALLPRVSGQPVSTAAVSGDGNLVVTAGSGGVPQLWDTRDGAVVGLLRGHSAAVTSVAFAPDGNRVVTVSEDGTARVWDVRWVRPVVAARVPVAGLVYAALSPTGARVLAADANAGAAVLAVGGHQAGAVPLPGHVLAASFSKDGGSVVVVTPAGAQVLDAATGRPRSHPLRQQDGVVSAALSPDGRFVVTTSGRSEVRVWSVAGGRVVQRLPVSAGGSRSAVFGPGGELVVTADVAGTARVWSWRDDSTRPVVLGDRTTAVRSAAFSPDGDLVVTTSADDTARIWHWRRPGATPVIIDQSEAGSTPVFSGDGKLLVGVGQDGTARVWGLTGTPVAAYGGGTARVAAATFARDGLHVVAVGGDGSVRLYACRACTTPAALGEQAAAIRSEGERP